MKKITLIIICFLLTVYSVGASYINKSDITLKYIEDYINICETNLCINLRTKIKQPYFREKLVEMIEKLSEPKSTISNNQTLSLEDGNKQCKQQYGSDAIWNGNFLGDGGLFCECRSLYEFNKEKTQCVKKLTNTERDRICKATYGQYSFGTGKVNSEGEYECACQRQYDWNSDYTKCVSVLYDSSAGNRACQIEFGANSYWGGKYAEDLSYQCECKTGYKWNNEGNYCILK